MKEFRKFRLDLFSINVLIHGGFSNPMVHKGILNLDNLCNIYDFQTLMGITVLLFSVTSNLIDYSSYIITPL